MNNKWDRFKLEELYNLSHLLNLSLLYSGDSGDDHGGPELRRELWEELVVRESQTPRGKQRTEYITKRCEASIKCPFCDNLGIPVIYGYLNSIEAEICCQAAGDNKLHFGGCCSSGANWYCQSCDTRFAGKSY